MKAEVAPVSSVKLKITIEVEPEEFKKEELAAIRQVNRTVAIPGFRKGKAPEATIRKLFGDRVRSDALSAVVESSYTKALHDTDIWPVSEPEIKVEKFEESGAVTYEALVEVRPKVEAAGYKGIAIKRPKIEIPDAVVEGRIEALRNQCATFEPAGDDYKAAMGDMAVIDFTGKLDGEPFEGGAAKAHTLMIGAGRMIPGFEEGVIGAGAGDEITVPVTFPAEYHAPHLAGKPVEFDIKVTEVKKRVLPELCDDFAKTAANLETMAELTAKVRESLEIEHKNRVERELRTTIITTLLAANEFEVPDSLVEKQKESSIERMRHDLTQRQIDPEAWGIGNELFLDEARKAAVRAVRWAFLADAIAKAESIEVTDAEVDDRIRKIAEADGRPYAMIKGFFDREGSTESLRNSLREQKTLDLVTSEASVEEVSIEDFDAWTQSA